MFDFKDTTVFMYKAATYKCIYYILLGMALWNFLKNVMKIFLNIKGLYFQI